MATYYFQEATRSRGGYWDLVGETANACAENPEPIIEQFYRGTGKEEPYFGWLTGAPGAKGLVKRVRATSCAAPAKCLKALRDVQASVHGAPERFPGFAWVALEQPGGKRKPVASSLRVVVDGEPSYISAGWDPPTMFPIANPSKSKSISLDSKLRCLSPNGDPYVVVFEHRTLAEEFTACFGTALPLLETAERNNSLIYICCVA